MIKFLQRFDGKNVNAQHKMGEELKRGTFVKLQAGLIVKANNLAEAEGILVRDVKNTEEVAMGYPVSDWDAEQDVCKVGEYAGIEALQKGEKIAVDNYTSAPSGAGIEQTDGKIVNGSDTSYVCEGEIEFAGHKMLAIRVIK